MSSFGPMNTPVDRRNDLAFDSLDIEPKEVDRQRNVVALEKLR